MTARIEKTVFISYRRTNLPWALAIYQDLHHNGFDVFFDYLSIDSGNFEKVIIENIKTRAHFIVILTPSALERCNEPGDWLRREIETAIEEGRNIVPLMLESFDFGSPLVKEALTGKLASLNQYNGLRVPSEYFLEAMQRLRDRYLDIAVVDIKLPSLTVEANEITETQKSAASEAPLVEKEQLTAQEWFERGYVLSNNRSLDEAIRCFTEAINLKADFTDAYIRRGLVYGLKKDTNLAIQDFTIASKLNPNNELAYAGRGVVLRDNGDIDGAIKDFTQAIKLRSDSAMFYIFRSSAYRQKNDIDNAIKDCNKAIRFDPKYATAFYSRGIAYSQKNNINKALADFDKAIKLQQGFANAYFERALLRDSNNDLNGALEDYDEVIRLEPDNCYAYYNRGAIWEQKRNLQKAILDYENYLEFGGGQKDGDQKDVEETIKKLKSKLTRKKSPRKKTK